MVDYDGHRWVRMSYDSGAAATVLPAEMVAADMDLKETGQFTVASGGGIPRYGDVRLRVVDDGNKRMVRGVAAGVRKPLGSAAEFSGSHDCFLWSSGGMLIPKAGRLAKELQKSIDHLYSKFADGTELPMYREGNLYNFCVRSAEVVEEVGSMVDHGQCPGVAAGAVEAVSPSADSFTPLFSGGGDVHAVDEWENAESFVEESLKIQRSFGRFQKQRHELENHAVHRPWCPLCIAGRGVGAKHKQKQRQLADEAKEGASIYSDYFSRVLTKARSRCWL